MFVSEIIYDSRYYYRSPISKRGTCYQHQNLACIFTCIFMNVHSTNGVRSIIKISEKTEKHGFFNGPLLRKTYIVSFPLVCRLLLVQKTCVDPKLCLTHTYSAIILESWLQKLLFEPDELLLISKVRL
jgi:hypothetical protein